MAIINPMVGRCTGKKWSNIKQIKIKYNIIIEQWIESKKEVSSVLFFMLSDDIETTENEM